MRSLLNKLTICSFSLVGILMVSCTSNEEYPVEQTNTNAYTVSTNNQKEKVLLRIASVKGGNLRQPFVLRESPEEIFKQEMISVLGNDYEITDKETATGITVSIELTELSEKNGYLNLATRVHIRDTQGEDTFALYNSQKLPTGLDISSQFSYLWLATYKNLVHLTLKDLSGALAKAKVRAPNLPGLNEIRGYIAEMYINRNIQRVLIDAKSAQIHSVSSMDALPVKYILYGIARGNGFKAATEDFNKLRLCPTVLNFFDAHNVGIVLLNADRTSEGYEPESAVLAQKMGSKGPLTYVLADRNGKQVWHTFGRLNVTLFKNTLPARNMQDWVDSMYTAIHEKKENLDWFAPYIDTNAFE